MSHQVDDRFSHLTSYSPASAALKSILRPSQHPPIISFAGHISTFINRTVTTTTSTMSGMLRANKTGGSARRSPLVRSFSLSGGSSSSSSDSDGKSPISFIPSLPFIFQSIGSVSAFPFCNVNCGWSASSSSLLWWRRDEW